MSACMAQLHFHTWVGRGGVLVSRSRGKIDRRVIRIPTCYTSIGVSASWGTEVLLMATNVCLHPSQGSSLVDCSLPVSISVETKGVNWW